MASKVADGGGDMKVQILERMCLNHKLPMYWDEWAKDWVCEECTWECDDCGFGSEAFMPENPQMMLASSRYIHRLKYDNDRYGIWKSTIYKKINDMDYREFCILPSYMGIANIVQDIKKMGK